ncbi:MAG: GNAT family N-acetyltransferase [Alphaproteobacteria bacterium]|nr:GNAT family N-acetyltransferase [Alphaproteobacteria bacterium]MDE2629920.1 GNAT family N-acetyltransferase [Alphaproteobacteria bacterium]
MPNAGRRRFREATDGDVECVVKLINEAFAPAERVLYDGPRIDASGVCQKQTTGTFILENGPEGTIRGCVYVEIGADGGYFGLLAVSPACQRQGIAQALIREAESFAQARGCSVMEIKVVNHRQELFPFYCKAGYSVAGTEPFEYERLLVPSHFVVMRKELAAASGRPC